MCAWYVRPISSMCKRMHVTLTSHMHSSAVPDGTKLSLEPSLSFPFWGGRGKKRLGLRLVQSYDRLKRGSKRAYKKVK